HILLCADIASDPTLCLAASTSCPFFSHDPSTTVLYTLSLHDALPICGQTSGATPCAGTRPLALLLTPPLRSDNHRKCRGGVNNRDRKSTRLNSSHGSISYAVFCLKKKKHNRTKGNAPRAYTHKTHTQY